MNKSVIASFVAACLVSSAALANGAAYKTTQPSDVALNARVAKAQAVIDQNSAVNTVSTHNWLDRISVGGMANVDLAWGDHTPIGSFGELDPNVQPIIHNLGESYSFPWSNKGATDISVNNANLFVDAKINPWVKAHLNLAYLGDQDRAWPIGMDKVGPRYGASQLLVDEAYISLGNLARTPFFGIIGKQYVPFGHYDRYPMIVPLTQIFSQTRATAIQFGLVTDLGFYAKVYGFNGGTEKIQKTGRNIENFGAQLGYFGSMHNVGLSDVSYDVNVGLIRNMYDTMYVSPIYHYLSANIPAPIIGNVAGGLYYKKYAPGLAVHADLAANGFTLAGDYVAFLDPMRMYAQIPTIGMPELGIINSKIWAAAVTGGYAFKLMNHDTKINLSYQCTGNGKNIIGLILPHFRYQAEIVYNLWNKTDLGLSYAHDVAYRNAGIQIPTELTGGQKIFIPLWDRRSANTVVARLSVRF